jgi:phage major head subunit gpT-like protein
MTVDLLSSRAVIGEFYATLENPAGMGWINALSVEFDSDQASEQYAWLGQVPQMREWLGGRNAKGLPENAYTIRNKHYEATIDIPVRHLRRDKSGQAMMRIRELANRSNSHWASLISTLIINGESTACYDSQFFFDGDHSEGDSGTQDNDLTVDISALAVTNHGSTTAPSVGEIREVIMQGISAIQGFVDNEGEPLNETAQEFVVMTPVALWPSAVSAATLPMVDSGESNIIPNLPNLKIGVTSNPRLTWTDKIAVFRADGDAKPFIRQKETEVDLKVKAEGSEYEFDNDAHQYGIDAWRNVGYGMWQQACLLQMT